ncbi:MAG: AEC family transporter [Oscillospiraceae bacterium]|nr:AEC family transporter [Oscillospiraceae bacterium]
MLIKILPVFDQMIILMFTIILGYIGGKTKVMSIEDNKPLSKLVNCITNPCGVLHSALCVNHALANGEVLKLVGITFAMYAGLILVAQLIPRLLRVQADQRGQYKFMMIFSNVGYMGMPVVRAVFGEEATFCVSIFIMVFYLFIYTYGIHLICGSHETSGIAWKKMIAPMTVCSALGLIGYLAGIRISGVLEDALDTVSKVTTPCAMLIIGCALSALPLKAVFSNWRVYAVALLKLLVIPAAVYLCLRPLMGDSMILGVMVVIMAMPIASNFTMLSAQYGGEQKLAASSVFITTLLSVLTIPVLAGILMAG